MTRATRLLIIVACAAMIAPAAAQRQGRRGGYRIPPNPPYDGAFRFCRIMFRNSTNGDGAGWFVD